MWLLIFTLLTLSGDVQSQIKLEEYLTKHECLSELYRIQAEMAKAYPGDKQTMIFTCYKRKVELH